MVSAQFQLKTEMLKAACEDVAVGSYSPLYNNPLFKENMQMYSEQMVCTGTKPIWSRCERTPHGLTLSPRQQRQARDATRI